MRAECERLKLAVNRMLRRPVGGTICVDFRKDVFTYLFSEKGKPDESHRRCRRLLEHFPKSKTCVSVSFFNLSENSPTTCLLPRKSQSQECFHRCSTCWMNASQESDSTFLVDLKPTVRDEISSNFNLTNIKSDCRQACSARSFISKGALCPATLSRNEAMWPRAIHHV